MSDDTEIYKERKSHMGKYVFECSVREVVFEMSDEKKCKVTLHLIPDASFSSKRKDDSGER